MPGKTLFEKLNKANDEYHEAVNNILEDKSLPIDVKAPFASQANTVFQVMASAKKVLQDYYEKQEEK